MAGFPEKKLKIYDAYDGLMGIELAISIKPDLIILDYTLPGIDGEEVYKRLMGNPNTCNAEFIIISGDVKFEPTGTKFLQKPFEKDEFIKEVKRLLQIKTN